MTKIRLQDYHTYINELLYETRFSEVVVHCKYILQQYPRHVTTYRALGKALLEEGLFEDAVDIFRRTLSADPEDFIAHIGLSLALRDAQFEQSVWHMERAFDIAPYDRLIQQELREIYARRDGVEIEQLPLTRGALARLYSRGELYPQAISEVRLALKNDQSRVDLQCLLVELLWFSGRSVDAVELSQEILTQLPFSIKANAILAEVAILTDQEEKAADHLTRLESLTLVDVVSIPEDTPVGRAFNLGGPIELPMERMVNALPFDDSVTEEFEIQSGIEQLSTAVESEEETDWLSLLEGDGDWGDDISSEESDHNEPAEVASFMESADEDWGLEEIDEAEPEAEPLDWLAEGDDSLSDDSFDFIDSKEKEVPDWLADLDEESNSFGDEQLDDPIDLDEIGELEIDSFDWGDELPELVEPEILTLEDSFSSDTDNDWLDEQPIEVASLPEGSLPEFDWLDELDTAPNPEVDGTDIGAELDWGDDRDLFADHSEESFATDGEVEQFEFQSLEFLETEEAEDLVDEEESLPSWLLETETEEEEEQIDDPLSELDTLLEGDTDRLNNLLGKAELRGIDEFANLVQTSEETLLANAEVEQEERLFEDDELLFSVDDEHVASDEMLPDWLAEDVTIEEEAVEQGTLPDWLIAARPPEVDSSPDDSLSDFESMFDDEPIDFSIDWDSDEIEDKADDLEIPYIFSDDGQDEALSDLDSILDDDDEI